MEEKILGAIEALDKKITNLEGKFGGFEGRFDSLENRFDKFEDRFVSLETEMNERFKSVNEALSEQAENLEEIGIDSAVAKQAALRLVGDLKDTNKRIAKLDEKVERIDGNVDSLAQATHQEFEQIYEKVQQEAA